MVFNVGVVTFFNPFSTNAPITDKPGSWFLLTMFEKHLWKSDILSEDAGHFASKSQLPGFYLSGTLVENGLNFHYDFLSFFVSGQHLVSVFSASQQPE